MFETRLQTYWTDADPAGRVYFANFFRFAEFAESELFRSAGKERMALYEECQVWMPRVESFARFSKPILAEEAIIVRLRSKFQGKKTVRLEFEILHNSDRSLLAEGYITIVTIDRKTGRSCPMPTAIRDVFALTTGDEVERHI
jgi:acyl-CoA thioester hydrolase